MAKPISKSYIKTIVKLGLVGDNEGLSSRGSTLRTVSATVIDKARKQLAGLKDDTSRSPREKANLASQGLKVVKKELERQINLSLIDIDERQRHEAYITNSALASTWDQSSSAIYAIELGKDKKKAFAALEDKNSLMALANAPEAISGIKSSTIEAAKEAYISTHHPEIDEHKAVTSNDLRLTQNLVAVGEELEREYDKFTKDSSLKSGAFSSYT